MYDPKFTQKEMYDQYGSSRKTTKKADPKPSKSSGFGGMGSDPAERFGGSPTKGIGAKPTSNTFGGGQDNNPNRDEYENKSTIDKVKEKAVDLFKSFGAKEPEALIVDGKRVYQGPLFSGYDPTVRIGEFGGDAGKKNYFLGIEKLGIPTYPRTDVSPTLPPADNNPALNMFGVRRGFTGGPEGLQAAPTMTQPASPATARSAAMTAGINRILKEVVAPNSKEYKIKKGDTLSRIAVREGVTVDDLVKINGIEDKNKIYAGDSIIIPKPEEVEQAKEFVLRVSTRGDEDPDAQYYQSTVPEEDREFAPELGADAQSVTGYDDVPQTITTGLMANPNAKNIRNLYKESQTTQLKAAQTILKQKGYYQGQPIDGVRGTNEVSNTTKAIQTFQHNNGIPVTGELNDETKLALARGNSIDAVAATRSSDAMLANISEGEGSYGAANNGTSSLANTFRVSGSYYSDTYNKPLVEMTINEILNAQTGNTGLSTEELLSVDATTEDAQRNREMFAVGAYQIIPETMQAAISAGIVSGDEKFTPSVQDNIAIKYLAGSKRGNLRDYVQGKSGVTLNQAVADMAKEWASYPVPEDTYNDEGVLIARQGESRYGSGNQAQHDLEATKEMLRNAREAYLAGIENI